MDFLFVVEYYDGTIYRQTPVDMSLTNPEKSCWYDVVPERVKRLSLVGKGHIVTVDLTDGHFEVDGRNMPPKEWPHSKPFPVYFHRVEQSMGLNCNEKRTYFIGWKTATQEFKIGVDCESDPGSVEQDSPPRSLEAVAARNGH